MSIHRASSRHALSLRAFINWQQNPQSNYLAHLVFPEEAGLFKVEIDLVAC